MTALLNLKRLSFYEVFKTLSIILNIFKWLVPKATGGDEKSCSQGGRGF